MRERIEIRRMRTSMKHLVVLILAFILINIYSIANAKDAGISFNLDEALIQLSKEANDNSANTGPAENADVLNSLNQILSDKDMIKAENVEKGSEFPLDEANSKLSDLASNENGISFPGDLFSKIEFGLGYIEIIYDQSCPADNSVLCDTSTGTCTAESSFSTDSYY